MLINKDLYEKFFKTDSKDNFINVDINTFGLFDELLESGKLKTNRHRTFAFAYYCLVSYLWKYSKYGDMEINTQDIKTILGIHSTEKRMDYIIKKNGLLDSIGLTETTRDFPISTTIYAEGEGILVTTLSDIEDGLAKDFLKNSGRRYTCKKPLLQYEREDNVGLMFSKDNVLSISLYEFTRCVLCPDIGFDGLYVYAYLKFRTKMLGNKALKIFYAELENRIGYKYKYLHTLIENLKLAGMITINTRFKVENGKVSRHNSYNIINNGK